MDVPRRTGTLLVFAGTIGLATTFLVCVFLHDVLAALRGWRCHYGECSVPAAWGSEQSFDVLVLWFGGLRSVLQIRAGIVLQEPVIADRRGPLVAYLVVATIDCALLVVLAVPSSLVALAAGWPLAIYALTRTTSLRALVWETLRLPRARVV